MKVGDTVQITDQGGRLYSFPWMDRKNKVKAIGIITALGKSPQAFHVKWNNGRRDLYHVDYLQPISLEDPTKEDIEKQLLL